MVWWHGRQRLLPFPRSMVVLASDPKVRLSLPMMLSLLVLGTPIIQRDHQPMTIARRKSRALLYYLAVHTAPVPRERLLALLWPEAEQTAARHLLRTALFDLRRAIGSALQGQDDTCWLAEACVIDARDFANQLAKEDSSTAEWHRMLALYRGELLDGFALPDAPAFDDWLMRERQGFRQRAVTGWVALSQLYLAHHDDEHALAALDQALTLDPLREDVQRAAMQQAYALGDRAGALVRYERFCRSLATTLGVEPMAATRDLADAIRRAPRPQPIKRQVTERSRAPQHLAILLSLGQTQFQSGALPAAQTTFATAADLATAQQDRDGLAAARLGLVRVFTPQARYTEALALLHQVRTADSAAFAQRAEFLFGLVLSTVGADLVGAAAHLQHAAVLAAADQDPLTLADIAFEQGNVLAQQGDLPHAIARYRQSLALTDDLASGAAYERRILSANNLAYHLHLLGSPAARPYADQSWRLAQATGALALQPYVLATLGELALGAGNFAEAERHFTEGAIIAEQLALPERVAGLTANLGRLAHQRGQRASALQHLHAALAQAQALGLPQLTARVHLWLVPLVAHAEATAHLTAARTLIADPGSQRLLNAVMRHQNR